ncbi:Killer cell lectin-like receptor subfamily I member 1 [Camelus dromedarius]|uniref:Killer cell lectin-like receptor subfamily I member 1 n=1 Tax=Camelus dromedarius TaxID=9838 RepID=A0A5N4C660_CAMDR|nr:Killer cell lectin-like receptor subfamily I member 1 [Camelus dromedarius]
MLKNKQNKGTANKQEVIYTEPKFSRSPQKRKTPETNQSNVISGEQQVNYMELKFPRSSHHQHRERLFRKKRKDHQSRAWQVTAGSLGVLCVVLMATFGILLANKFFRREDENGKISPIPTLSSPNGAIADLFYESNLNSPLKDARLSGQQKILRKEFIA